MIRTTKMQDVLTIDNCTHGVGDAVMYCWMLTSANADGERLRIHPRQAREVFELFNCGQWCEPEPANFEQLVASHPPKGEVGGRGWLRLWLDEHGFEGVPFKRPTYSLTDEEIAYAKDVWASRPGTGLKVLVCPDGPWKIRVWNEGNFARLAAMLDEKGHRTIAALSAYREHPFPWAVGGIPFRRFAALIATADILIGNESGPVHLAATMGVKSYCIYGPTRPELMHEQYGDMVVPIATTTDRIPCLGCNFEYERGCRDWCKHGCMAMADVTPFAAAKVIADVPVVVTVGGRPRGTTNLVGDVLKFIAANAGENVGAGFGRSLGKFIKTKMTGQDMKRGHPAQNPMRPKPRGRFYLQDECILQDVFDQDSYKLRELSPDLTRFIDVGACIGAFAALVRSVYPNASVVMAECEPSNAKACRESPVLGGCDLVEAAVLYGRETAHLMTTVFPGSRNTGGSTVVEAADAKQYSDEYREFGEVPTTTLEAIMDARGWGRVDVVKLDCEGSEINILEHCDRDRVGCFVGEWHDRARFMDVVARRYADWTLDILKDGPQLGLFRLTHP